MPTAIRLLNLGPAHWLRTQSVYHALAETMTVETPDTIVLTRPSQPYLCIGYHQELDSVLDRATCRQLSLPIIRRRVGGGTTYLDANQLFYQYVFHHTRVPATVERLYAALLAAPVAALRALGLDAELRGENEIEVDGQRIAGIGGGRIGEAAVVVGNVLLDFDYDRMARVWRAPSEPFRHLAASALREHVTTLRAKAPRPMAPADMEARLLVEFPAVLGRPLERGELTKEEWGEVESIEKRLMSEEWLSLHANGGQPMTTLKISRGVFIRSAEAEVNGWHVRAALRARDDEIVQAILESEPARDWSEAEARLRGTKIRDWTRAVL
ncbi:MAG TPA: hypothetical protein VFL17_17460 [Anaerolineae bacterium]|nr:hypothetical protein [Anaerolineae bacterium]